MVVRAGDEAAGGIDINSVVEVPRDKIASPGDERDTTVDGLSPVNGATIQEALKPHLSIHHLPIVPIEHPPKIGSAPSLWRREGPPHTSRSE